MPLTVIENEAHVRCVQTRPAAFLAHLIASAKQVPQARHRGRGAPAEAIAAYRSTMARVATR